MAVTPTSTGFTITGSGLGTQTIKDITIYAIVNNNPAVMGIEYRVTNDNGAPLTFTSQDGTSILVGANSVGHTFQRNSQDTSWTIELQLDPHMDAAHYVHTVEPATGEEGDLWFNPTNGQLFIYTE